MQSFYLLGGHSFVGKLEIPHKFTQDEIDDKKYGLSFISKIYDQRAPLFSESCLNSMYFPYFLCIENHGLFIRKNHGLNLYAKTMVLTRGFIHMISLIVLSFAISTRSINYIGVVTYIVIIKVEGSKPLHAYSYIHLYMYT